MVASHRWGEIEDSFIADLAVRLGASQIKASAPCRGEQLAKYNHVFFSNHTLFAFFLISSYATPYLPPLAHSKDQTDLSLGTKQFMPAKTGGLHLDH
ncbi:hypothetical protein SLEP1_g57969 [Rubroshorea leprosula]|uniref:phosphopyruvate hydratase n=1 Tax=Rubroshorea leprosula TaxID=152421 RepID=A0AAV5MMZ1_9ROSI|nr:hypothetical protein SLEP1_g57969 [Rubroshorea leprosula]